MKFSQHKKNKIRGSKLKKIIQSYNCIFEGDLIPPYLFFDEIERSHKYCVISKFHNKKDYYVLCKEKDSNEIVVLKLLYTDFVRCLVVSDNKILEQSDEFKKWLKYVNFEVRSKRIKYKLSPSGKIIEKNTDYSGS